MSEKRQNHYFFNPLVLSLLTLMVLNDHFLKYTFPSELTGKVSDLTGLFTFPLFLCTGFELLLRLEKSHFNRRRTVFYLSLLATNLIFIGLNTSQKFVHFYLFVTSSFGIPSKVTMDLTDLLVLPVNLVTFIYMKPWITGESQLNKNIHYCHNK